MKDGHLNKCIDCAKADVLSRQKINPRHEYKARWARNRKATDNAYRLKRLRETNEYRHRIAYGHTQFLDDPELNLADPYRAARKLGFRSGLEVKVANELDALGVPYAYESFKITYTVPARLARYTPDYHLPNGIIVETKGVFVTADRQKHKLIKDQHPDLDIRFVFSNAHTRISKQSKTTYANWCETHGFSYSNKSIPQDWIDEPAITARVEALSQFLKGTK